MSGISDEVAVVYRIAAACLAYPGDEFNAALAAFDTITASMRHPAAGPLREFLTGTMSLSEAAHTTLYVDTFDFTNKHSLYLSWWTDGDTRNRGAALVGFKDHYRAHGFDFDDSELPDFLPAVLEFSALSRTNALLIEHRPALELLRIALAEKDNAYAQVLAAVCATLPGASPKDRAAARAMARSGPPRESVGLEPYGHLGMLPLLTGDRR
ncbi:nitrate reductase molybdenum cofactor assembly chaperone [Nocardia sp. ET3-3]|uniref:Nitrate reductase molybdenum cofactor assembly chaperone n=1 Tax=Nocardia terrae TaxID=2675851 RepID=A0A7K1V8G4_9NOCA|nr:nitrate reductase molybdenum cofactor assembly chaperone [Nocardia terrae]MVU82378.1 nitrate reductase molybdenum cofactor assembly chaperone [Nocardia terrae]